ncbi:hypothetical protein LCGC14_2901630 [marine sediment metagenome]|uniref:HNH nuclease domain-containing protein n=1 Tax=marine sediment metagenome TaxID=412755 RepID=A0A0F8XU61_9ZZZZ
MSMFSESVVSRFWDKVEVLGEDDCWTWHGQLSPKGYGQFRVNGKMMRAHRYSFEVHTGPIGDLCVCHTCDNPSCVNPEHLWLGTQLDNIADRDSKGHACGRTGYHVLGLGSADTVRQKYATGEYTQRKLAAEYGVSQGVICRIIRREGAYA